MFLLYALHTGLGTALGLEEAASLARTLALLHLHDVGTEQEQLVVAIVADKFENAVHTVEVHLLIGYEGQVQACLVAPVGVFSRKVKGLVGECIDGVDVDIAKCIGTFVQCVYAVPVFMPYESTASNHEGQKQHPNCNMYRLIVHSVFVPSRQIPYPYSG